MLLDYFYQASPDEIIAGINWYKAAHAAALEIATYCNCEVSIAAAVIASISPRCKWEVNITWAWRVAHSVMNHTPIVRGGRSPLWPQVLKAISILQTRDLGLLSGQKVLPFFDNILYPETSQEITIDSWAYRAYLGLINTTDELPHKITPKRYAAAAAAYREAARNLGILPCQFQAIIWVVCHRLEGK